MIHIPTFAPFSHFPWEMVRPSIEFYEEFARFGFIQLHVFASKYGHVPHLPSSGTPRRNLRTEPVAQSI
jgi:hypothetical protein